MDFLGAFSIVRTSSLMDNNKVTSVFVCLIRTWVREFPGNLC
jgi:hypothetical protein